MKRLYFLLPDATLARAVAGELREVGVADRHIHAVGNRRTSLDGFHQATVLQTSALRHGLFLGVLLGGLGGFLGGLLAIYAAPGNLELGTGILIIMTLAGATLGAVISAMVASDLPNREIQPFQNPIAAGRVLLIVDVERQRVDAAREAIARHHPRADIIVRASPHRV